MFYFLSVVISLHSSVCLRSKISSNHKQISIWQSFIAHSCTRDIAWAKLFFSWLLLPFMSNPLPTLLNHQRPIRMQRCLTNLAATVAYNDAHFLAYSWSKMRNYMMWGKTRSYMLWKPTNFDDKKILRIQFHLFKFFIWYTALPHLKQSPRVDSL